MISQIARAVVGSGPSGNVAFFVMQATTMLILVLAANTSFADFPRLASFHADDHFLPTPLTKRGRRLVFANGIIVLAGAGDGADGRLRGRASRTSSRSTRSACSPRSRSPRPAWPSATSRLKEPGWKPACGSTASARSPPASSAIVIAVTKFTHGAWIIMVIVPDHRGGARAGQQALRPRGDQARRARPGAGRSPRATGSARSCWCHSVDEGLDRAMRYVDHLDADRVRAVHVGAEDRSLGAAFWARYGCKLEFVDAHGGLVKTARALVQSERAEHPDHLCAVVVPETIEEPRLRHVLRHNDALRLKAGLLFEKGIVVVNIPTHRRRRHAAQPGRRDGTSRSCPWRPSTRARARRCGSPSCCGPTACARCTSPSSPEDAETLEEQWAEQQLPVPLDVVAAPYRELGEPLLARGRGAQGRGRRPHHRGDRRVRAQVVAARAAQPPRAADEGAAAVRARRRRRVGAPPRVRHRHASTTAVSR